MIIIYRNEPLERYLKDASAGTPTPGGGSVASLVGALATTMSSMTASLTIAKEQFRQYDAQLKRILEESEKSREVMLSLMEEDITVYNNVIKAFALPKSSETEKKLRSEAIQNATVIAMEAPLKATMRCLSILELTHELADITNPNLISDVGVAGILAEAALQCAKLNVETNLATIRNQSIVEKTQNELIRAEQKAKTLSREIQEKVRKTIKRI